MVRTPLNRYGANVHVLPNHNLKACRIPFSLEELPLQRFVPPAKLRNNDAAIAAFMKPSQKVFIVRSGLPQAVTYSVQR